MSLFGQPQQQTQASLFGQPSQQQSVPSLFGAQSQSAFGSVAAPATSTPAMSSSFSFGPQPVAQSAPSLFQQPQSVPSLFAPNAGQPQQPQPGQLGQPPAQQPQPQPQQQQQQQQQNPQYTHLPGSLLQIIDRLNPMHPSSPFQAALYNVVAPELVTRYARPAGMHAALYDAAQAANPDPSRQVPVHANGIDDLLLRAQMQSQRMDDHAAVLERLRREISDVRTDVSAQLATKLAAYRRRHRELARKLLRIAAAVDVAAVAADHQQLHHQQQQQHYLHNHSHAGLSAGEVERKKRLEVVVNTLVKPSELKHKLHDLAELAPVVKGISHTSAPVTIRDRRAAETVRDLLSDQLEGIQQLGVVCAKIDRDLHIMSRYS